MAADGTSTSLRAAPARPRALALRWATPARRLALADAGRAWLLSRALVWGTGLLAIWLVGVSGRAEAFDPEVLTAPFGTFGDALVGPGARWDASWYLQIAADGYGSDPATPAFFPLYPGLVRLAGALTGSAVVGGLLVSWACLGAALYLLRRLTALELGEDAARYATWACALFPAAFCFSAVYSESLFLAVSVGAVYAARTNRWAWAGLLGALATATRSAGIVLLVPLAWEAVRQARAAGSWRQLLGRAGWLAVVPAGLVAFLVYLQVQGAGWKAALDAQQEWYRELAWPFAGVWDGSVAAWDGARQVLSGQRAHVYFAQAGGDPLEVAWTNLGLWAFGVLGLAVLVGVARRLPAGYGLYMFSALALPLSTPVGPQPLMSLPRFEAVLFPAFMWAGWLLARRGPVARSAILAASAVGLALLGARFATWRWVA